jgi:dihydrofolate reductase
MPTLTPRSVIVEQAGAPTPLMCADRISREHVERVKTGTLLTSLDTGDALTTGDAGGRWRLTRRRLRRTMPRAATRGAAAITPSPPCRTRLTRFGHHAPDGLVPLEQRRDATAVCLSEDLMSSRHANGSRVTLHVVASLDGFIARKDNTVSWLESPSDAYDRGMPEGSVEDEDISIDCFVLGSRTYEHALELGWPYGDTPTVVATHRALPSNRTSVEFYAGDLTHLVDVVLAPRYKNIWLVGGAMLAQSFLELGLVDDIRLSIAPVLLGGGLHLFGSAGSEQRWHLKNVLTYKTGFVELVYGSKSAKAAG